MSEKTVTSAYVTLRSKILRFAARFFPAEEDADDALQEAFCRLWQRHDNINTISEAEALAKTRNGCRRQFVIASGSNGAQRKLPPCGKDYQRQSHRAATQGASDARL